MKRFLVIFQILTIPLLSQTCNQYFATWNKTNQIYNIVNLGYFGTNRRCDAPPLGIGCTGWYENGEDDKYHYVYHDELEVSTCDATNSYYIKHDTILEFAN
jgi:hypothetical protein